MKSQKDELLNHIRACRSKSSSVIERSNEIGKYGQQIKDLAEASEKTINCVSSTGIDFKPQLKAWSNLEVKLDRLVQDMGSTNFDVAPSAASTAVSCMLNFTKPNYLANLTSPDREAEAWAVSKTLENIIDKLVEKPKALHLLYQFRLSSISPGKKSPIDLLEDACAAFERPVTQGSSASTSLIPMRQCINSTIAALLQRRPQQEPAKSQRDKIISICKQTAYSEIEPWAIDQMAARWEELLDELSSSKDKDVHREEWKAILRKAMAFLIEFLESLDQNKMKSL